MCVGGGGARAHACVRSNCKKQQIIGIVHMSQNVLRLGRILKFGFEQICHEYSNIGYWIISGIGLPYINIVVAESADRSFDVTLCKHCGCFPVSMVSFKGFE